jgi:hypothetical protein
MAYQKFLPETDSGLESWASNFLAKISANPQVYGLTSEDAASLLVNLSAFSAEVAECSDPRTRTRVAITDRNTARATLKAQLRLFAKQIQSRRTTIGGTITPGLISALGLPNYPEKLGRSSFAAPVPDAPPNVLITATNLLRHTVRFQRGDNTSRRAKPATAAVAVLFYTTSNTRLDVPSPAGPETDHFAGIATRNTAEIT